jgi:muramoyltetrapeptide carboxypeptidase LdcA involved in peptidoglycan recycling
VKIQDFKKSFTWSPGIHPQNKEENSDQDHGRPKGMCDTTEDSEGTMAGGSLSILHLMTGLKGMVYACTVPLEFNSLHQIIRHESNHTQPTLSRDI